MTPGQRNNLQRLLAPRHVAVIGGHDAEFVASQCAERFAGPVWGVNPKRSTLGGQPCFASVAELPDGPDAVFVAVPRTAITATVRALAQRGAGGVICYTAGFGELGESGAALETELVQAAGDLALVGPNCYGVINYVHNAALWAYGYGGTKVERGVAIVSQSGMLSSNLTMTQRNVPFAYVISSGNQAALSVEDYIDVLIDDLSVTAIGLHIETLGDPGRFAAVAARALRAGIPLVALKTGTSEIGARLAVTHTGSMSGTDELNQALFDRLGIIRVHTPALLLETLKMLTYGGVPRGRRVAAFTCSGGDAAIVADEGARLGLTFPPPGERLSAELAAQLPDIATVSNPLDYTTPLWGDAERMPGVFASALKSDVDTALIVQDYPLPGLNVSAESYRGDSRSFMQAVKARGIPGVICSSLPDNLDDATRALVIDGGAAPLQGVHEALTAIRGAATLGERRAALAARGDEIALELEVEPLDDGEVRTLNEQDSKTVLRGAGMAVPDSRVVHTDEAAAAAADIGFPVAVKLLSDALTHKSEAGALKLGVYDAAGVVAAVEAIDAAVKTYDPAIDRDRFLIERMTDKPVAELLVSIRHAPGFGQVLMLGGGGTLVELMGDACTLILPTDIHTIREQLRALKTHRLIAGFRGAPPGDEAALLKGLHQLIDYAAEHRDTLAEIEINPLLVLEHGICAVDAVVRTV